MDPTDTMVDAAVTVTSRSADGPAPTPSRLGRFVIRRVLAAGGMGTVYEAEQDDPRRVVALKTLKQGIRTESALRRFRVESEILARLRHPGIAQIYEAGTLHEPGAQEPVPYFAMELVEGARALDRHVAETALSVKARVRLFLRVCDAVQYGHERGVIHRDLKPGNILVDAGGNTKLIDYGVAAARDRDATDLTLIADQGLLVGTLLYLSPEQLVAKSSAPDVRGDVYSLGICLYEVLTGYQPFDLTEMTLADAVCRLVEDEPNRPCRVRKDLPRELEWIILKALEKDPQRRYASVRCLREDLARYLDGKALDAAPRSSVYRARKFASRHKAGVAFAGATLLGLVATVTATINGLARESRLREHADSQRVAAVRQAERATAIADSVFGLLGAPDPALAGWFERAAATVRAKSVEGSELRLELMARLGRAALDSGCFDAATALEQEAFQLARALNGEQSVEAVRALSALAEAESLREEKRRGRSP